MNFVCMHASQQSTIHLVHIVLLYSLSKAQSRLKQFSLNTNPIVHVRSQVLPGRCMFPRHLWHLRYTSYKGGTGTRAGHRSTVTVEVKSSQELAADSWKYYI